jgi:glutamate synthase (NADPH/NADH) large chain
MRGGTIVILGPIGRNFASGMSGGSAYVRADAAVAAAPIAVPVGSLDAQDWALLESLLSRHWKLTGSPLAAAVLGQGPGAASLFRRVAAGARAPTHRGGMVPAIHTPAHNGELRHAASNWA